MEDATDEDQHADPAATDPHLDSDRDPDPATVLEQVDDVQDLILSAGDEPTPPPAPVLLDDGELAFDAEELAESDAGESAAGESDARQSALGESLPAESNAGESDSEQLDLEESVEEEDEAPAEPTYRWFDCTGDDEQVALEAAEAAREALEDGDLVVLPTDTVYGIGADAFNAHAVQRLLDAKVRGRDMPPPVLIGDANLLRALVVDLPEAAETLVARHWPGALTVICQARGTLKMDLGETEGTVGVRVPDHDLTRELLRQTGPLAVSSANLSGLPAALTCNDALEALGGSIAVYLDGGALGGSTGGSSTMVDFTQDDRGQVLRYGVLSLQTLRETLPDLIDLVDPVDPIDPVEGEDAAEPIDSAEAIHSSESTDSAESTELTESIEWDGPIESPAPSTTHPERGAAWTLQPPTGR